MERWDHVLAGKWNFISLLLLACWDSAGTWHFETKTFRMNKTIKKRENRLSVIMSAGMTYIPVFSTELGKF